ncbi:UvrD-helicase-domain-containing protein [Hyaloscypha variabilis F]|uniref:DNA 3'-5' helicase n=1 Tax=Hyaloscypha variabilis (strain UAMH 11265 / GT02V1 / F) TaxID=1149755 RepID=A0A2J6SBN0_HYAVF|nr:UvrD-helicase-domain-containing protein [Hyaloscypha variabilis F]
MNCDGLLTNLNKSQHAAVSSFADTLAILAGPGSGKTHTLTSRTAWLLAQGLQPWNVIVATFTVKAAREMKERIGKLIGNGMESKLILGTFHSISRRYLARYGHLIDIRKDFGIADSSDSLAIIKRIVKRFDFNIDPKVARSRISGRKARTSVVEEGEARKSATKSVEAEEFERCYIEYEDALKRSNLLDYDDLLLRCVDLLRKHPSCVSNVEAVLIDEFQDTNLVQFDLMRLFAAHKKRITIVGDPDQSIYGFRAAEIKNYRRMLHQYPDTVTIALEENYRSSGAILLSALNVIEQDSSRVAKSLLPTHIVGTRPVLRKLAGAHKEAEWIVTEIQRIKGLTGDLLDLNDFAVLLRSASLSRLIETALGKAGIAYRMVGGLRFYDRVEIKTILDYLRVINQPDNNDALARIINTPSRRIGESTIKSLLEEADQAKMTLWSLVLGIVQGKLSAKTQLKNPTEKNLSSFVHIILTARAKLSGPVEERMSTVELIYFVLKKIDYEEWLVEHHGDVHKARWENVQELITQATDFQDAISFGYEDETLPGIDGLEQRDDSDQLSKFLANVALASEVKKDDEEGISVAQVTISTIHAAKGLEWPVVFIPATYQGSIPHSRAEDTNEERRLLYVAMTRAKALLYMSYSLKNSQGEETTLSPFLTPPSLAPLLDQKGPSLRSSTVQSISQILRRNLPSTTSITLSSASLPSIEDDLFPKEGIENAQEKEARLNAMTGRNMTFTMGQQAPKRRRVELGRSASNLEEAPEKDWKPTYATTMDRASSFTAAAVNTGMKSGFVSAGCHLQVLKEQSVNITVQDPEDIERPSKRKATDNTKKSKAVEGQGTLFGFLGKPEPKKAALTPKESPRSEPSAQFQTSRAFNQTRPAAPYTAATAIDPSLSMHRLAATTTTKHRPHQLQPSQTEQQTKRNDYVFLSSSPPRPKHPIIEEPVEAPPGLVTNPPLLPLIRPPIYPPARQTSVSMHETSIEKLKAGGTGMGPGKGKTLGVRRSMNGWAARKGGNGGFVPPVMKRPP